MNKELPDFVKVQQGFADHIKNPQKIKRPEDVDERHMSIYRDLFFNNVMGFLDGAFPVLAEIMGKERWRQLGREFFSNHKSISPYFLQISEEFLAYLETEYLSQVNDPDYIYELAHYEWLELYVDVSPSVEQTYNRSGDPLLEVPVLSAVVEGFLYQFPVHTISLANPDVELAPSALIVYRAIDDSVGFVESNSLTLQMLALLKQGCSTGREVIYEVLAQHDMSENPNAVTGGVETIRQWHELGIIRGTRI